MGSSLPGEGKVPPDTDGTNITVDAIGIVEIAALDPTTERELLKIFAAAADDPEQVQSFVRILGSVLKDGLRGGDFTS